MTTSPSPSRSIDLSSELAAALTAYRGGDRAAAEVLVRRATPLLWHVARAAGADPISAEDAVQNTLLALFRHADTIAAPQAVLRWLVVTAQREARRTRRPDQRTVVQPDVGVTVAAPRSAEPEPASLEREQRDVLWNAVDGLSERCRQLLRVIAFGDRPDYSALSHALGMPVGSIGPTRGRCLAKLRALLAADPRWTAQ
jgi:RNA polymerase sigma factor (sigma-70 family)